MVTARVRRRLTRAVPLVLVAGLLAVGQVEDYAGYEGQSVCATKVQPGTQYLADHVSRTYGGSIVSLLRACTDGASEHKDGRAVDWSANASNPADVARVDRLLTDLFATDRAGNDNALARRMGIMYVIWDDQMYSAYRGFAPEKYVSSSCRGKPLKQCSPTLRHRDHVHISLSHAGGAAQTSFYRDRDVASLPVFVPGTRFVDPERTQLVTTTVGADEGPVRLPWRMQKGRTYRMLVVGRIRTGAGGPPTDAACRRETATRSWVPAADGLTIGRKGKPWRRTPCTGGRVQELSWTAKRDGKLLLTAGDATPADNRGRFVVAIVSPDLDVTGADVAAAAPRG
ncbi:hypothetical protein KLP28_09305 [Nocardioidaceae bacterium]|nr:hypothetical protein KLP28_09305 [Nocardioidaceae bacterium]